MKVIQNYILILNFVKIIIIDIQQKKHNDPQSQAIYDDKNNSKKSLYMLENDASGVQVGDIEQAIV